MAEIKVTEAAVAAFNDLFDQRADSEQGLRLYVVHRCHCGGVKYGMALTQSAPDDKQVDASGISISVSPEVADQPGSAEIDFIQSPLQSGFTLTNSEHSCGGMHGR